MTLSLEEGESIIWRRVNPLYRDYNNDCEIFRARRMLMKVCHLLFISNSVVQNVKNI